MVYSSILAARLMGVSYEKLRLYHAALNIPSPPSRSNFVKFQKDVLVAAEHVARESMNNAKLELEGLFGVNSSSKCVHCVASYDGAYQMRPTKGGGGFSRYCFASAISVDTGRVLSYDVACNSCEECSEYENKLRNKLISEKEYRDLKENHDVICQATYSDLASIQLESAVAPVIVRQAYERGIIFSGLVCDGDNKTDEALKKADVYAKLGLNLHIDRFECLSHVVKRMKTNLCLRQKAVLKEARTDKKAEIRYLSKETKRSEKEVKKSVEGKYRGNLITDSKPRGYWNDSSKEGVKIKHLSVGMCAQIASYYHLAVKRNKGDVMAIIKAVNAIPLHLGANDENAEFNHQYCPCEKDSWCQYQSAKFDKRLLPSHPNYLSETAVKLIQTTFADFKYNKPEFIEKISGGMTSNNNECIHSILFQMVRKTESVGIVTMRTGAALAIIRYNDGYAGVKKVFELLGVTPGEYLVETFREFDNSRIVQSSQIIPNQQKRFAKKQRRSQKVKKQVAKHGEGYSSGKFKAAQPDSESGSEDDVPTSSSVIDNSSSDDCCAVCGFSEESGQIGILVGLPEFKYVRLGKLRFL